LNISVLYKNVFFLKLQIQIQSSSTPSLIPANDDIGHEYDNGNDYDIDRALERLQDSLLGTNINSNQSSNCLIQQFSSNDELCLKHLNVIGLLFEIRN
jgi:hypothetical protein